MECKLTITGSFSDIQNALVLLQGGKPIEAILDTLTPVHHPHEEPTNLQREAIKENGAIPNTSLYHSRENDQPEMMLTPMGPMPIVPMERVVKPTKAKADKAVKPKQVKDPLPEIHCGSCGILFTPKRETSKFCSEKCYQADWYDRHKKKENSEDGKPDQEDDEQKVDTLDDQTPVDYFPFEEDLQASAETPKTEDCATAPLAVLAPEERASKLQKLSQKLKEIKASCPAPTPRPELSREIL